MSDRFMFRIWDKGREEYIYNPSISFLSGYLCMEYPDNLNNWFSTLSDSNLFVVQQSTGLKDKNGKLIYEGDIVRAKHEEDDDSYITVVKCDRGCLMIDVNEYEYDYTAIGWAAETYDLEIVGNIYENPELIMEQPECK